MRNTPFRMTAVVTAALALSTLSPQTATAQWSTAYEQFYLQASHNWQFRNKYAHADRLFNAFDYGHAILYETLWTKPDAPASELETRIYTHLTQRVLTRPPRVPLEEAAIEPMYAQLAPEAKVMFDWTHLLHRQLYDVLADERRSDAEKDTEVARLVSYYRSRPGVAFSSKPKSMELMQEQPYSLAFRQRYPKFNGLIWGYHWLQVGLYEPLIVGKTVDERQAGVRATVSRFWQMLADPPNTLPHQMPMTAAVAPAFAARFPEAAIIFDNLHSMHDVVSDILTNPSVPRSRKRAEILRAAQLFRDDTSYVMPVAGWRVMSEQMGAENMGGPAVGFLPVLPTPSVTYGAVMTHDRQSGAMTGFKSGAAIGGAHAHHDMPGMASPPSDSQQVAPPTRTGYTAADVAFMHDMIGHHAQALTMAALVPARSALPALRALAERLAISQREEIAVMQTWLRDRGESVPSPADGGAHAGHAMPVDSTATAAAPIPGMAGKLTAAQLSELGSAQATAFDRLFLQFMIQHHDGALVMVRDLLRTPRAAQEPELYQIVSDVDTDQRAEIRRMVALLTRLSTP